MDQLWIVAPRCDPRGSDVDRVACDTVITSRIVIVDSLELALSDTTGKYASYLEGKTVNHITLMVNTL